MPTFQWPSDPVPAVQAFEIKHHDPDAGALLLWAFWAVDALYYLADLDAAVSTSIPLVSAHRGDIVEVAHARWATSTCITGLDLCAAAFGRVFCGRTGQRELALPAFNLAFRKQQRLKEVQQLRAKVPASALSWMDAVLSDPAYAEIKTARNALIHARIRRHFIMGSRLRLQVGNRKIEVREIIETARDLSTRNLVSLLSILPSL